MSKEQKAEVLRRLEETQAHPETLERFEEPDVILMFQQFAQARALRKSALKAEHRSFDG